MKNKVMILIKPTIVFLLIFSILCTSNMTSRRITEAKSIENLKEYVITVKGKKTYNKMVSLIGEKDIKQRTSCHDNNIVRAEISTDELKKLNCDKNITIEEDFVLSANGKNTKSDLFNQLKKTSIKKEDNEKVEWNLQAINVDEIDQKTNVKNKVKVAVLDSGIDFIAGINLKKSVNFVETEDYVTSYYQDLTGHGTNIASVIAGDDDAVQGINQNVDLYSVKVLDQNNQAPVSRIIEGIYWCIENDINIINMSFGTTAYSEALHRAVVDAYDAGILMVAAAENMESNVEYPAAFEEVMAVASTNTKSEISNFSNSGDELDVAAPGENIRVLGFFGLNGITHGTSIAVPQVVGVASLLWEKDISKSNEFIRQLINVSSKNIKNTTDCGLLDVEYALEIYDDFAEKFEDKDSTIKVNIPSNKKNVEIFNDIEEDSEYVEGRWIKSGHQDLVTNGAKKNDIMDETTLAVLKAGAVYPDRSDSGMSGLSYNPEYHGGYEALYGDDDNSVNYIACYEFVTRIALKNGDASSITNYKTIKGLGKNSYDWMKPDFRSTSVGLLSWSEIFSNIKVNGKSVAKTNKNKKYFTWGIALHILGDTFAHKTYRKSDKKMIVHNKSYTNPDKQIPGADDQTVVKGRWVVAKAAIDYSIACLESNNIGDAAEIIYALEDQTYTSNSQLFLKKRLAKYVQDNGWNISKEVTNANID